MISICLKSKNNTPLNIIEKYLKTSTLPEIYYSQKKFKYSNNLIIHYKGNHTKKFTRHLSKILCDYIIQNYEKKFIIQQLKYDFFYFTNQEKQLLQELTEEDLNNSSNLKQKYFILQSTINDYFSDNCICNISGFINFRLHDYKLIINQSLESVISNYVLQKEYIEYVNLLKEYVNMQDSQAENVHLIYTPSKKILLDNNQNIITNTLSSQIYLSDITFSSNDFILNALLTLLPKKIYIHLQNTSEDNFIEFLKLVFSKQYCICTNCVICEKYFSDVTNNNI